MCVPFADHKEPQNIDIIHRSSWNSSEILIMIINADKHYTVPNTGISWRQAHNLENLHNQDSLSFKLLRAQESSRLLGHETGQRNLALLWKGNKKLWWRLRLAYL